MRFDEISPETFIEMSSAWKPVEDIITGLEYQLNLHLLKLIIVPSSQELKQHWRQEIVTWLSTIASIRFKQPIPMQFYFTILFREPFEGNETQNVIARLLLLRHQYGEIEYETPEDLVEKLRLFHTTFANGCANAQMNAITINELISEFEKT